MPKITNNVNVRDLAKESITYFQKQKNYDKAVLKIALARTPSGLEPYWGTLRIFHKSDVVNIREERNDYGSLAFVTRLLSANDVIEFLKSVAENQTAKIADGITLRFEDSAESLFLYGNEDYGRTLKHSWPCNNLLLRFPQVVVDHNSKLVKKGLPMYPDPHTAIRDFLKLGNNLVSTADTGRYLLIQMPDFRAKISGVTISGNKVKFTVETRDISKDLIVTKIYMEGGPKSYKSGDLTFDNSKTITCEADFEPSTVNICIIDESNDIIDARDIYLTWFRYASDVKVETPSLRIREIALRGENENVEFKREASKTENKILETITAFANGGGGIILIGIDDDTTIYGWEGDIKKLGDSLRDSIYRRIEPNNIKFELERIEMEEGESNEEKKAVIAVRIQEGQDKPYRFTDRGFIIRQGSSNRHMTRYELDEIYQKKGSGNNPLGQSFLTI